MGSCYSNRGTPLFRKPALKRQKLALQNPLDNVDPIDIVAWAKKSPTAYAAIFLNATHKEKRDGKESLAFLFFP